MPGSITLAYLIAGIFFFLSIRGLSAPDSSRAGNLLGMAGMAIAVVATLAAPGSLGLVPALIAMGLGAAIGWRWATSVAMTEMPQLVGAINGLVGLSAVLAGLATFWTADHADAHATLHWVEVALDVAIGALTFTGSFVAFAKLDGRMSSKPVQLPMGQALNAALALAVLALVALGALVGVGTATGTTLLLAISVAAGVLGFFLVRAIGGADMPVVVSLLNSYSGWTAAAAGFMLSNDLLILTGALVGSSGAILTYIMCEAMNRSLWNVVFGGLGANEGAAAPAGEGPTGEATPIDAQGFADLLAEAKDVIIAPGYGMAVARAQSDVKTLTDLLQARGARVRFAIHPVAGRLPGHMNVLLAEAGVPYDLVHELEALEGEFEKADLTVVVGANDTVNPAAQTEPSSPIYGMPVLEVWKAKHCVVLKRSLNVGYAGVGNPLFFFDNTRMYFGDAAERLAEVNALLRAR